MMVPTRAPAGTTGAGGAAIRCVTAAALAAVFPLLVASAVVAARAVPVPVDWARGAALPGAVAFTFFAVLVAATVATDLPLVRGAGTPALFDALLEVPVAVLPVTVTAGAVFGVGANFFVDAPEAFVDAAFDVIFAVFLPVFAAAVVDVFGVLFVINL